MPFKLPFVRNVDNQAAISFMTVREFAGKTNLKHMASILMIRSQYVPPRLCNPFPSLFFPDGYRC